LDAALIGVVIEEGTYSAESIGIKGVTILAFFALLRIFLTILAIVYFAATFTIFSQE